MSDIELGFGGLKLCAALFGLIVAYCVVRKARLDYFRQELFIARDRLWDSMRENNDLDCEAHRTLRAQINGLIRIAPVMNLFVLLSILRLNKRILRDEAPKYVPFSELMKGVKNPASRRELVQAKQTMQLLLINHLFLYSIPGCLIGWPLYVVTVMRKMWSQNRIVGWLDRHSQEIFIPIEACPLNAA